jgi:shikimate dehydrogenase
VSHRWACLLGQPVAHSWSPELHNAAFKAAGIDAHYEARLVRPDELARAIAEMRAPDCLGGNVTAPHKVAALQLVDQLGDEVVFLGALNTVVNRGGRLVGANTDAGGLARWMRLANIDPRGRTALVLGAGGAARSAAWALAERGATSIRVLNRTTARAERLVAEFQPRLPSVTLAWGELSAAARPVADPYSVVINATSLGHDGLAPDVHPSCYSRGSVAIELAYNPPETGFMAAAREAGARAENGLGMLLHQAALAFERWTEMSAPMEAYAGALEQRVAR